MKRTAAFYILALCLICMNTGCSPLLLGVAAGGAGVYAVSKDTIQGDTDKTYNSLFSAALEIGRNRGTITQEDYARGSIETQVDASRVWIRLVKLTRTTTRVRVSSRKYHFPNLGLAQDMFTKILEAAK
ncbi:MAG: DUF3568 family protein [Candidatus Omnitrophota bacterium]|jgi:hypothetical protein|nr:MAG: DUF3568 family protein [Candidatus Omnitrophota bacterium]